MSSAPDKKTRSNSVVAPSAGRVTLHCTVDGSGLPPVEQERNEIMRVWTNLSRLERHVSIEWEPNTGQMRSKVLEVLVDLDDEYEAAELLQRTQSSGPASFVVNGRLRRDASIWFELMAENAATDNVAVLEHCGTGSVAVSQLLQLAEQTPSGQSVLVPLYLCASVDEKTGKQMQRGAIAVHATFHSPLARALFVHSLAPVTRFELTRENAPYLSKIMEAEIMAQLTPFVEEAKKQGVAFTETMAPNARIIAPWRMTPVGQLWAQSFVADDRALGAPRLPSDAPLDERYVRDTLLYALRRRNWQPDEAQHVLESQLKQTGVAYDDRVTELMSIIGTAACVLSTSLPYASDTVNLNRRIERLSGKSLETNKPIDAESYDDAALRLGGDCEDLARLIKQHVDMLVRGKWTDPLLCVAQRYVASFYVPTMNLGSVTSPSLGNKHDVEKTAAHLADSERHHAALTDYAIAKRALLGAPVAPPRVTVGDDVATTHKHAPIYPPDPSEPLGGHSWAELVPLAKFAELTRRIVPDVNVRDVFGEEAIVGSAAAPGWTAYLPHLVLEGTGRIDPLIMPRVAYAVSSNADSVRVEELNYQRTLHTLISSSPLFKSLQSEARAAFTVHVPNTRLTSFYRQSTQVSTDRFLSSSGGVASFNWVRTHAVDEAELNDSHDPLYEQVHAKLSPVTIARAAVDSVKSAALQSKPAVKLSGGSFAHVSGELDELERQLNSVQISDEAKLLANMSGLSPAIINTAHGSADAATLVNPSQLTLGVDLEERIAWPVSNRIALVPSARLSETGALALRTYQRHLPSFVVPSKKLPTLGTADSLKVAFVRLDADTGSVASNNTARLVQNDAAVDAQRGYIKSIAEHTRTLFADSPWMHRDDVRASGLTMLTFFFKPHDVVNEKVSTKICSELTRFKSSGLIKTADFYVEEPTQHIQNAVLRLICVPPPASQ